MKKKILHIFRVIHSYRDSEWTFCYWVKKSLSLRNKNFTAGGHTAGFGAQLFLHTLQVGHCAVQKKWVPTDQSGYGKDYDNQGRKASRHYYYEAESRQGRIHYPECGCLRETHTWHSHWHDFSAFSQSRREAWHGSNSIFQEWQCLVVTVRRQFRGDIFC